MIALLIVLTFALTACQTAATETAPPSTPSATVAAAPTETPTPEPAPLNPADSQPPEASLRIDGERQAAAIGTYCWPGVTGELAVCADKIGIPTVQEALPAGSPLSAVFELPLEDAPSTLVLTVKPVGEADAVDSTADGYRWWQPLGGEQHLLPLETEPQIELALDQGLYLFSLFAQWWNTGDVVYGFLVEVQLAPESEVPVVETNVRQVVTRQDNVPLYTGPGGNYDRAGTAFLDLVLPVVGASEDGGWWFLDCAPLLGEDTNRCWVSADPQLTVPASSLEDQITTLPTPDRTVLVQAVFGLNMRAAPDAEAEIISIVPLGNLVEVTGISEDGEWRRIRCQDGTTGSCWISSDPALSAPIEISTASLNGLLLQQIEEQFELWRVDDLRQPVQVSDAFRGAVSPDGEIGLNCCLSAETYDQLALVDFSDGSETILVESTGLLVQSPAFWPGESSDPTGKALFLSKTANNARDPVGPGLGYLTVVNLDGSSYEILDPENNTHAVPSISPDGTTIAYTRGDDVNANAAIFTPWLYTLADGPQPFDYAAYGLEEVPDLSFGAPAWSPDGRYLAWMVGGELSDDGVWKLGIALFDLDENTVEVINPYVPSEASPQRVTGFEGPSWSPDGQWLVWTAFPGDGIPGFWILDLEGNALAFIENAGVPAWSPDGQMLAFNLSATILVLEAGDWTIQHSGLPAGSTVTGWVNPTD